MSKQPFSGNNNPFSITSAVTQKKVSGKNAISFFSLKWLYPTLAKGRKTYFVVNIIPQKFKGHGQFGIASAHFLRFLTIFQIKKSTGQNMGSWW